MTTVGIRELKAHLSRHLKRVQAGTRLHVTARGRVIAAISPVDAPADVSWAHQLVAEGRAQWNGGKPAGGPSKARTTAPTAADIVLEERR